MRVAFARCALLFLAGCSDGAHPPPATLGPDDPTVRRFLHPVLPFEWDWLGSDERGEQLLAAAATSRHVVAIYPAVGGGTHVAWGGLDEPWQSEPLSALGFDDAIGVDAATGPDDTVHVAFLRLRDPADVAPVVIEHLAWRAGEGVVETESVVGSPVSEDHVEQTRPDFSIGVRRDGTVDVVVGHTDQPLHTTGIYHQAIDLLIREAGQSQWTVTRVRDDRRFETLDEIDIGRFVRVAYDARDRPILVHWVENTTAAYSYGPELLIQGDDGLFSPSLGQLANEQADGHAAMDGAAPYFGAGYPDAWADPEYGWIYFTPVGGREMGLDGGVVAIGMSSVTPWPPDFPIPPHARRGDIVEERGATDLWVGGRVMTTECRGVETAAETLLRDGGAAAKMTTSQGRADLCGYARRAPVFRFAADEETLDASTELYPRIRGIDTDDVNASLVRYGWRTVYAHGHRPFDVGVSPGVRLYVSLGGWDAQMSDRRPWPSDDLLRIVESDPLDGADDVSPDLREIRVRVTGMIGQRGALGWSGFDLSNGQPVVEGEVRPGDTEDELVLALADGVAFSPGLHYRVWIAFRSLGDDALVPYPWQYPEGDGPFLELHTAGEPPAGSYAPDARGTPLDVTCEFCSPDGDLVPTTVPGPGAGPIFQLGSGDDEIDTERVLPADLVVRDAGGDVVPIVFDFLQGRGIVRLAWSQPLDPDAEYTIELPEELRTIAGRRPEAAERTLRFRTAP